MNMSRGGREGNNALLRGNEHGDVYANASERQLAAFAMDEGLSQEFIRSLVLNNIVQQRTVDMNNVDGAIRSGK